MKIYMHVYVHTHIPSARVRVGPRAPHLQCLGRIQFKKPRAVYCPVSPVNFASGPRVTGDSYLADRVGILRKLEILSFPFLLQILERSSYAVSRINLSLVCYFVARSIIHHIIKGTFQGFVLHLA